MARNQKVSYPLQGEYPDLFRLSFQRWLICALETAKVRSRLRRQKGKNISVLPLRERIRPLRDDDIPLVFLVHNDRKLLPSFLKHYRGIGVTRFLCVDDQSTDGSRELLQAQPDVDVFTSNVRYGAARRGRRWREALFRMHGTGRWYLNVDSDEYLIYQDYERRPLSDLIGALRAKRIKRLAAPMIDAYPSGALETAHFSDDDGKMPWEVAPLIDADGYQLSKGKRSLSVCGGMRVRVFDADAELVKYPLLFWEEDHSLGVSVHQPLPYKYNFSPIYASLLHFKVFSDFLENVQESVEEKQYFDGAREYKKMLRVLETEDRFQIECDESVRYSGSQDMIQRGFFLPVFG